MFRYELQGSAPNHGDAEIDLRIDRMQELFGKVGEPVGPGVYDAQGNGPSGVWSSLKAKIPRPRDNLSPKLRVNLQKCGKQNPL